MPPMMIFGGRKRRVPALTQDAPPGTVGAVSQNGWVNSELFAEWLTPWTMLEQRKSTVLC